MEVEQRQFRADPLKLKRLRVAAGLTVQEFRQLADLDRTTVAKILRGDAVFLKSIATAAENVFEIHNPMELLHPDELRAMGVQTDVPTPGHVLEWEIVDYLSGWKVTSNGLQYQTVKLAHRYLKNRFARGKCYELRHLNSAERNDIEHYLHRHAEVCGQVGRNANIVRNITAVPAEGLWWVLDEWESGVTLEERLRHGPLGSFELRVVMTGIAHGLAALHKSKIIRRELSPQSVLLRERDDLPLLTDLELAKLTQGGRTVSPDEWPDDPYRALEVTGETPIDLRADLHSWGRIFVHAATGQLCERGAENLTDVELPDPVREIVMQTVAVARTLRPDGFREILKVLKRWA